MRGDPMTPGHIDRGTASRVSDREVVERSAAEVGQRDDHPLPVEEDAPPRPSTGSLPLGRIDAGGDLHDR